MIGYVLEGEISTIIEKINSRLQEDTNKIKIIEKINYIKDFSYCYESVHRGEDRELKIKHIFLNFA